MKTSLLLAASLLAWIPQTEVTKTSQNQKSGAVDLKPSSLESNFLDLCSEIEEEQRKKCASACAASGKSSSFESVICGLGSSCKCT